MFTQFAFLDLSTPDLVVILVIIVLLFGSRKLPELSKAVGTTIRELRGSLKDDDAKTPVETKKNKK